jgi:hypothetical protein
MVRLVVAFIVGAIIGWRFVKGWSTAGELATVAVLILGVSFLRLTRLHGFYFAMWELSALAVVVFYWRFFAKRIPYPAELLARWQRRGSEHSARDRSLRRIRPYAEAGALAGLGLFALLVVSSLGLSFTRIAAIREHIERWHWLATVALFYGSSVLIVLGDRAFVRKSDPHAHDGAL